MFKGLLNWRLHSLAGITADYVCTPVDLRSNSVPIDGVLEVVAHPTQLGADFGDAYLAPQESLRLVLEHRLTGIARVSYADLNKEFARGTAALD